MRSMRFTRGGSIFQSRADPPRIECIVSFRAAKVCCTHCSTLPYWVQLLQVPVEKNIFSPEGIGIQTVVVHIPSEYVAKMNMA